MGAITHLYPNFSGGLVNLPMKLRHGWMSTPHTRQCYDYLSMTLSQLHYVCKGQQEAHGSISHFHVGLLGGNINLYQFYILFAYQNTTNSLIWSMRPIYYALSTTWSLVNWWRKENARKLVVLLVVLFPNVACGIITQQLSSLIHGAIANRCVTMMNHSLEKTSPCMHVQLICF